MVLKFRSRAVVNGALVSAMAGEHVHLADLAADCSWHVQVEPVGPVWVKIPRAHPGVCGAAPSLVIYDELWPPAG